MVTIYDVAKKAQVSIATVSYALNNKNSVSEKTRKRIQQIADELGYVPNSLAKGLHSKTTQVIGVIVPDITHHFVNTFIKHLQHFARLHDYFLLIGSNYSEYNTAREIIGQFIAKNVDALVISPDLFFREGENAYKSVLEQLRKSGTPFIMMNEFLLDYPGENFIAPDVETGQYLAARHVLELGHRFPVMIGGLLKDKFTVARRSGFTRALAEFGIIAGPEHFIEGTYDFSDGYEQMKKYMEHRSSLPDVFLAINDVYALGIYKALREAGLSVPEHVSLVGYDDLVLPTLEGIPLTTVKIQLEDISRLCVESLIEMKANPEASFRKLMPPELIVRGSVARK